MASAASELYVVNARVDHTGPCCIYAVLVKSCLVSKADLLHIADSAKAGASHVYEILLGHSQFVPTLVGMRIP